MFSRTQGGTHSLLAKTLYLSGERTLATLRNTSQMVGPLHSEHARHLLNDFKKCRAPQLGSRRTLGTTYTDTAFAGMARMLFRYLSMALPLI